MNVVILVFKNSHSLFKYLLFVLILLLFKNKDNVTNSSVGHFYLVCVDRFGRSLEYMIRKPFMMVRVVKKLSFCGPCGPCFNCIPY